MSSDVRGFQVGIDHAATMDEEEALTDVSLEHQALRLVQPDVLLEQAHHVATTAVLVDDTEVISRLIPVIELENIRMRLESAQHVHFRQHLTTCDTFRRS